MNRINHCQHDADLVASIARIRGWSEFYVFKAAHRAWFDTAVTDRELERFFVRYLFYQEAPHWVRHYVRNTQPDPYSDASVRGSAVAFPAVCVWVVLANTVRTLLRQSKSDALLVA